MTRVAFFAVACADFRLFRHTDRWFGAGCRLSLLTRCYEAAFCLLFICDGDRLDVLIAREIVAVLLRKTRPKVARLFVDGRVYLHELRVHIRVATRRFDRRL